MQELPAARHGRLRRGRLRRPAASARPPADPRRRRRAQDYGTPSYDKWLGLIGPGKPAISSETSSATSDRGEFRSNRTAAHVSAMNAAPHHATGYGNDEYAWTGIEAHKRVAGGFTWTGWDYKGEPSPDVRLAAAARIRLCLFSSPG